MPPRPASRRRERILRLTAGALAGLLIPATAAAHTLSPSPYRGGIVLPRHARPLGAVSARTSLRVTVALRPRNPRALAAYAAAVSQPTSPSYHRYLTVSQFARRFAPTPAQRRRVRAQLIADGLSVRSTSANGLSIVVQSSARTASAAFSTPIDRFALADGTTAVAPARTPRLRGAAAALVQGVVGLDSVAPSASIIIRRPHASGPSADAVRPHAATGATGAGPQSCSAAQSIAAGSGGLTAAQIAARYGLSNYYAAGDEGSGITIALYELEPFSASDVAAYQACLGTNATVQVESVDGGAGSGYGSGEAATDVEDVIGLAPRATVRVYEGPQSGQGAYQTYAAIVSDDAAQVVSTSWGLCEPELGLFVANAEQALFEEAAAQGQTIIAAAGDSGADDCGNGTRAVDDPASQPYVTGVGGTSAHGSTDTAWDDALGAGGGGASQLWGRPSWQTAAVGQSAVSCGGSGTSCREVPDLSTDADPATGYPIVYEGAWRIVGGTSAAAPVVASLAALADASPACAGHPLGFLAPALYAHAADFTDVTSGSNTFDGVLGWSAGAGYDMATGLGTPTAALGPALCGDSLGVTTPAAQSWTAGRSVSLTLHAVSAKGAAVTWSATGLPAGLSLSAATGRITGTPTAAGHATVVLTAIDANGASATASFPVTVTATSNASTAVKRAAATRRHRRSRGRHHRSRGRHHRTSHHRTSHRRHHRRIRIKHHHR